MSEPSFGSSSFSSFSTLFTRKRVGYTVFGAFAFVGSAAAINAATSSANTTVQTPQYKIQKSVAQVQASSSNTPNDDTTSSSYTAASTPKATSHIQVKVNGKNVVIPANGTVTQTTSSADSSSQTTTTTSASTSEQGAATNSNNVQLNVNVSNNSTTQGSSTP